MTTTPPETITFPAHPADRIAPEPVPAGVDATLLNVGCGPFRADGWLNVDVIRDVTFEPPIDPDMIGSIMDGLPIESGTVKKLYLGHVLEHIAWEKLGPALDECKRLLADDGELMVVGPDVYRAIEQYKTGVTEFDAMQSTLEDAKAGWDAGQWEGARHMWNCHGERVVLALKAVGFEQVVSIGIDNPRLDEWPVVSRIGWQCAVSARVVPEQ